MSDSQQPKTIILGKEYDAELRSALRSVLKELGGVVTDKSWGVAGSQEVERLQVELEGSTITVETETYIGLSITGNAGIVDRLEALVRQRLDKL